jgi:N-methylhydantoinase A
MSFRVGIDTGGTFTDAISVDEAGNLVEAKSPTTPKDLKIGIMNCMDELAEKLHMGRQSLMGKIDTIVHGTTQGTNAIIMRSGPKMGIMATRGHADTIQLRRVRKENMWDWRLPFPQPLVPRWLRVGIDERLNSRGEILRPLHEESVHKAAAYLKKMGVESIVVTLIFSFLNPVHERRVREIIKEDFPGVHVTLSSEVVAIPGEYERFSTAVLDAYIRPAIVSYIESLQERLGDEGFRGQLFFIQNNGGAIAADEAIRKPSTLAISGPAAGPSAAITIGGWGGYKNLLSVDMGGTSFDIAIIDNGNVMVKDEGLICDHRFSLPLIDIETLGAGGGSIAWFDLGGTLRVGPQSAGADPGPACYGCGGEEATVTDAAVVLGYINPDYFLGGKMKLRKDLAEKVIKEKVAERLKMNIPGAAYAMYEISNSLMANGAAHAFIKKGYDPREFVLIAGGSATPLSALKIATELGMQKVLVTKVAPCYCPFGMLGVDVRHNFSRYYRVQGDKLDIDYLKELYQAMEAEGTDMLAKEGIPVSQCILQRTLRMRYYGQFREVEVTWPSGAITMEAIAEGVANFHRRHKELFGTSNEKYPLEFMSFGLIAIGRMPQATMKEIKRGTADASAALKGERDAYFGESNGYTKTRIYDGDKLLAGNILEGPCIVEETMTTVVVPPGFKTRVDEYGNYITA